MKACSWFYANVESLTEGKLDDREWILRSLNHRYFNNIIAFQKFNNIIPFQKLETRQQLQQHLLHSTASQLQFHVNFRNRIIGILKVATLMLPTIYLNLHVGGLLL